VCQLAGSSVEPEFHGRGTPPGEIDRQWLDSTKLRELTGWQPAVTLKDGLKRTIDWYRGHPELWSPETAN
jgi:nucleoside-diphosphate-sugar epimerase